MLASTAATWAIVIVVVVGLATWLTAVALAARRPYWKNSTKRPMIGPVVGGIHYADGGRSVGPDPRAPVYFTDEEEREIRRRSSGQAAPPRGRPHVPGQPVPAQRTGTRTAQAPAGAGSTAETRTRTSAEARAGTGTEMGPGADGAAGAGSGAERQPVYGPQLPGQREATQDQPEHHDR